METTKRKKYGGRVKGTPNKDSKTKIFIKQLLDDSHDKVIKELATLKGKAYIDVILSLMEYTVPKLSRAEVKVEEVVEEVVDLKDYTIDQLIAAKNGSNENTTK